MAHIIETIVNTMQRSRAKLDGVTYEQLKSNAVRDGVSGQLDFKMPHLLNSFFVEIDGRFHLAMDCDWDDDAKVMIRKRTR